MSHLVLSIEDTAAIRRLIRLTLEYEGYEVAEAGGGAEGIDMARRLRPALVLLDLCMPEIDGIEVCRRLRADFSTARVPIVMLSAHDSREEIAAALAAGATSYIVKPFSPLDLVELVQGLIQRQAEAAPLP